MQAVLQALLALQEIDRDIFRAQGELKRLPAERAIRKADLEKRLARLADLRARASSNVSKPDQSWRSFHDTK